MPVRRLPDQLVALIHHVELSASGWRDRLAEQLVLAGLSGGSDVTIDNLAREIAVTIDGALPGSTLTAAIPKLVGKGWVLRTSENTITLSEAGRSEVETRQQATEALALRVRTRFEQLADTHCPGLASGELWSQFNVACLEPMVEELGARTHAFLSGRLAEGTMIHSMTGFVTRFSEADQGGVRLLLDQFFSAIDADVRSFVFQRLNAHFLRLAASLPEDVIASVTERLKRTVQLRLFLDTNFLFSVLDLHDNPANDAADELVEALRRLHGKLDLKLYVYPLTMDEVNRTLTGYEHSLAGAFLTPSLGRAALASRARVSGVVLRYLRAVSESGGRLSVQDFLRPYMTNLVAVLRSRGVEVYNASIDGLTTRQDVVDDIVDVQRYEDARPGNRKKSYESIRHDVALYHLVRDRRGGSIASPFDALFWIVTVDYRFLAFDGIKRRGDSSAVPICVHPAVLLQMLQLLAPRDHDLERAIFQGVRSLLPVVFDSDAEQTTLRILSSLARFENVDDLPEETVADILVNDALRAKISGATSTSNDVDLIRDAILAEVAAARAAAEVEGRERYEIQQRMEAQERAGSERVDELDRKIQTIASERDEVHAKLEAATASEYALRGEVGQLRDTLASLQERDRARDKSVAATRQWRVLGVVTTVVTVGAIFASSAVASIASARLLVSDLMSIAIGLSAAFGAASLVILGVGSRLTLIQDTHVYSVLSRTLRWGLGVIGAIFIGLIGNALWDNR